MPPCLRLGRFVEALGVVQDVVAEGALHAADEDAFVHHAAAAAGLAEVRADAGGDDGEGIDLHNPLGGLVPAVVADEGEVAGDVRRGGALEGAGRGADLHAAENGVEAVVARDGSTVAALAGREAVSDLRYQQRGIWEMVPAMVPMLRMFGVAIFRAAARAP